MTAKLPHPVVQLFGTSAPFRVFLITILAGGLLLIGGCGREDRYSGIPPGASVLAIGDSVTFGTGADAGQDYPAQLAVITGWTIHNHGIPGDTAAGVNDRLARAMGEIRPKLVLLEIGGNDFLRRRSEAEVKERIRMVLKQIQLQGIPVMLIAVPQFSPLGAILGRLYDAPLYAELAMEEKVAITPDTLAEVLSDDALRADAIHPNNAGYKQLAEGIADALIRSGYYRP